MISVESHENGTVRYNEAKKGGIIMKRSTIVALLVVSSILWNGTNTIHASPEIIAAGVVTSPTGGSVSQLPAMVALPAPRWVDAKILSANAASSYTIPSGAKYLLLSANSYPFYTRYNGTASIPSADVLDGTAPVIGSVMVGVSGLTSISFIAPQATIITIGVYK